MKKKLLLGTLILSLALLFVSCYTPSPLYGTWADNDGNKIVFMTDGTFSAATTDMNGDLNQYEGTYTVIDNVLIFTIKGDTTYSRNTPWDLSGAILKLTWTSNGNTSNLTLYHIAR